MKGKIAVWFKEYVLTDIWRKLVSLSLALLTWFGLRVYLTHNQTLSLKVRVSKSDDYYIENNNAEWEVRMTMTRVNREAGDEDWLDAGNFDLYVECPRKMPPEGEPLVFTIHDIRSRKMPAGVTLTGMQPAEFKVPFDRMVKKEVRIAQPADKPRGVNKLVITVLQPTKVNVTGPASYLKRLDEMSLEELDLERYEKEHPGTQELKIKNPYAGILHLDQTKATVSLKEEQIVREVEERLSRKVRILPVPAGLELVRKDALTVELILRGKPAAMEKLLQDDIICYVNPERAEGVGKREYSVLVGGVPTGVNYEVKPATLMLELRSVSAAATGAGGKADKDGGGKTP